eukprot:4634259-Amphidinium_carterae.1
MDTLGFEPTISRLRSGCDTTTPCAQIVLISKVACLRVKWLLTEGRSYRMAALKLPESLAAELIH